MSEISGGITLRRSGAGPAQQSDRGRANLSLSRGNASGESAQEEADRAPAPAAVARQQPLPAVRRLRHRPFCCRRATCRWLPTRPPPVLPSCDPVTLRGKYCEELITQFRSYTRAVPALAAPFRRLGFLVLLALPCELGGGGFACCLQSPIRSRGRLLGGVGFFE